MPSATPVDARRDWGNTGGTDFNTNANWSATTGGLAPGVGDVGWFTSVAVTQPNLSASVNIAGLYFSSTTSSGYNITSTGGATFTLTANQSVVGAETTNTDSVAIAAANTSGTNTIDVPIILAPITGTNSTISQASGGKLILNGVISGSGISLTKITSGGILQLNGANTYTGGFFWGTSTGSAAGIISLGSSSIGGPGSITSGPFGTGTFTSRNSGVASNNFIQSSDSTTRTISNSIAFAGASLFNVGGTGDLIFDGTVNLGTVNRTFTINNTNTTFSNTISSTTSGGGLTKDGPGKLILTGTNTYSGATNINGGTLQLGNGGTGGSLANTVVTIGSGANFTINQSDTVTQGTEITSAGLTGAGSFTQAGTGTTVFTVNNNYSGGTFITNGTLKMQGGMAALPTNGALQLDFSGIFDLNGTSQGGVGALNGSGGTILNNGLVASTLTIGNGGVNGTYTGTIANGTNTLALTKTGAGTQILLGTNTYTGATQVDGGTLLVNGNDSAATGAVSVNNAGTILGGIGTIGGAVTVNTLANITGGTNGAIGTLTMSSTLTFTGSSTFLVDINGTTSDRLNIGGLLDLTGLGDVINFNQLATPTAASYTLATYTGVLGTFNITGNLPAGYTLVYLPTELDLVMTPIPEPGTWIGAALALLAVGYTQRKRFAKRG